MPHKKFCIASTEAFIATAMVLILASSAWAAPKYKVLHAFGSGQDGGGLWGSLAFDKKGNLYGTTSGGGAYGDGTVFELTPGSKGKWSESILHSFPSFPNDGGGLFSTPIVDAAGNLYGTTEGGGGPYTDGTVFELIPGTHGWTETVLHRFRGKVPAGAPQGPLTMDAAGNLYGTADSPFELSRSSGTWKLTLLHKFPSYKGDGNGAGGGVILDATGNVYGVTVYGGGSTRCSEGCGIAFELRHSVGGKWKEHILHDFGTGSDGVFPGGPLVLDGVGKAYGTTVIGGVTGNGIVYRLAPQPNGPLKETILYNFTEGTNGFDPSGGAVMDKSGNLYGVTVNGGDASCGCGVVYKLAPRSNGKWKYTVLHRFAGYDGAQPVATLILDSKGNLYGTTATGGAGGAGVAFELTP